MVKNCQVNHTDWRPDFKPFVHHESRSLHVLIWGQNVCFPNQRVPSLAVKKCASLVTQNCEALSVCSVWSKSSREISDEVLGNDLHRLLLLLLFAAGGATALRLLLDRAAQPLLLHHLRAPRLSMRRPEQRLIHLRTSERV